MWIDFELHGIMNIIKSLELSTIFFFIFLMWRFCFEGVYLVSS
jgi:hypothetical protein